MSNPVKVVLKNPCGCTVIRTTHTKGLLQGERVYTHELSYCRLHEAASSMRDMLVCAAAYIESVTVDTDPDAQAIIKAIGNAMPGQVPDMEGATPTEEDR